MQCKTHKLGGVKTNNCGINAELITYTQQVEMQ